MEPLFTVVNVFTSQKFNMEPEDDLFPKEISS